ncbi:glycosyltransferase family 87 protein [Prosthecomicrobium hirschii]|uniref:glycosyltransferase family 87 protein n=1 Tax=Prosthecodimorpha hirschii TaxID=665126 RepID=UPI002220D1ED|nr:glycosyltransferase family 87 protein [Prosthecomicrobium hirschii]MCW1841305.1 DUF2029 domain-containing protein [Prosthecomicrobium hirschii]
MTGAAEKQSTMPGHGAEDPSVALCAKYRTGLVILFFLLLIPRYGVVGAIAPGVKIEELVDFHAFYMVSQMVLRGEAAASYVFQVLFAEPAYAETGTFMPWTYPPPALLLVAPFSLLPTKIAYLIFVTVSLGLFLFVIHRIAGRASGLVLVAMMPAVLSCLSCGQTGFLAASLLGLAALGLIEGRSRAGAALGLMVIKPHLAITFGLAALTMGRLRFLAVAFAVALAACAAATLAFGWPIWTAFLGAVADAKEFLLLGYYPLVRMVSTYAFLKTAGVPAEWALAAQTVVAIGIAGALLAAVRLGYTPRQVIGFALMAGVTVSPYAYDYDMPVYAVGLALLIGDLLRWGHRAEQAAIFALGFFASTYGYGLTLLWGALHRSMDGPGAMPNAPAALAVLAALAIVVRIMLRARAGRPAETSAVPVALAA